MFPNFNIFAAPYRSGYDSAFRRVGYSSFRSFCSFTLQAGPRLLAHTFCFEFLFLLCLFSLHASPRLLAPVLSYKFFAGSSIPFSSFNLYCFFKFFTIFFNPNLDIIILKAIRLDNFVINRTYGVGKHRGVCPCYGLPSSLRKGAAAARIQAFKMYKLPLR